MAATVGTKAEGLADLPAAWTPDFVVITSEMATQLTQDMVSAEVVASRLKNCSATSALERLFLDASEGVIVRSSSTDEGMDERGLFKSRHVKFAGFVTVAEAAIEVWNHAAATRVADPIPLVVQRYVQPRLLGHLSNEVRLRADRRDWVVEFQGEATAARVTGMRARKSDRIPLDRVDASCDTSEQLSGVLRKVAGTFTRPGSRHHLEWVWDGARLWLVQHDLMRELRSEEPRAIGWAKEFPALECFRPATGSDVSFPKVRCIADYTAAGLPHQDLRLLADPDLFAGLADSPAPEALLRDLALLADRRAVIRTDVRRGEDRDFDVLRARTDAGYSSEQLLDFIRSTLEGLAALDIKLEDIVFLVHPFVPADASAWSLAAPSTSQVQIDATYGLPDGLLYYPHDSYVVDARGGTVRRQVRCKSQILVSGEDGVWRDQPLGSPWDWRPALSDDEARTIASMSKRLADHLGQPVEIMFFVRTHIVDQGRTILPWVHRDGSHRPARPAATGSFFPSQEALVRNVRDLQTLSAEMKEANSSGDRVLIHLRPEADVLHDAGFLEQLVNVCRSSSCTIELEGSTLSHIYYELVRNGLNVQAQDLISTSGGEPVSFGKLVRDLIPENIAARGEHVVRYQATGDELQLLLRAKVVEEALEIARSGSSDELLEEIGDALDVLASLCTLAGTDLASVSDRAEQKRRTRGGFNAGQVLVETREPTLEEATAGDGPRYAITEEVRREVERHHSEAPEIVVAGDNEVRIPYELQLQPGTGTRILVEGVEIEFELRNDGAVIRRAVPALEHPDQLDLGI
ncbi:MAG TPA: nucleoside triphosphate pyrophosphohydrolase [Baekduia sp.]|uniref:nucleoside triphosphate pyrophosphohydrolase n=1 Tax=Baekduia sp. TaxID=2600305 RepID=UPI002D784F29|nr:nucleoside triphosphate pyrophosphohydrolase [Baekduia sp.]HET6509388.1 nucleoside triphosphate pyrophosphohydrolase [Baekduia sp.]